MRDYKFSGKCKDNGEWVFGGILQHDGYVAILHFSDYHEWHDFIEVIPETVGQYTGLKDKHQVEIYEGDICTANWYDLTELNHTTTGVIEFSPGWMSYWLADYDNKTFEELNGYGNYSWDIEVIGNIHDNPELLKGGWQE